MDREKETSWAGFDVGKNSFVAALDYHSENVRSKITALPSHEFKRTKDLNNSFGG